MADLTLPDKKKVRKVVFVIIILLAIFLRLLALFISDNFHGIAAGKIIEAKRLIGHPDNFSAWIAPAHGPVHMYLIALAIKLFDDSLFVPRLLSLLMGIGLLIPYYWFIKLSFNDEVAIITTFIIAFFPLHIIHSVLSTAETTFLFFLFAGLFFFLKYRQTRNVTELIFSAGLLAVSSMCRFEGGLFIIMLSFFLVKNWKRMMLFLIIACILPIFWLIANFLLFGSFFYFLESSDLVVQREFGFSKAYGQKLTFLEKFLFWPGTIKDYFGWIVFLFGIAGLCLQGLAKKNRLVFFLLFGMLSVFVFKTVKEELAMQPRYGMSLGFLFVPFFAIFFKAILQKLKKPYRTILLISFFLCVILRGAYLSMLNLPHTPEWVKQTSRFLHKNLDSRSSDTVYIDSDDNNFREPIKLFSGIEVDRFVDFEGSSRHTELLKPSDRENLKYIVFISDRQLKRLKEVFRAGKCKIYQMDSADENDKHDI